MGGIGVITNPRSRQNKRNPGLAHELGYILGEKGEVQQPPDLDALAATARRFREHKIDILCVNGGDGTMHKALTAMVLAYGKDPLPKIAILPSGTMNTVAHGLRLRGSASEILDYIVQRYHTNTPMPTARRWLLEVDGRQYGFLFGNGLCARFLEIYYEGSAPTPAKALWLLIRASLSAMVGGAFIQRLMAPYVGSVTLDGVRWLSERWLTLTIGSVDDIGMGFRPFFKSLLYPGRFHVVGIKTMNPFNVVRELPRIYWARQVTGEGFDDDVGYELVLQSDEPIGYMIDGDFHQGGTQLTVRTGPAIEFIIPERS